MNRLARTVAACVVLTIVVSACNFAPTEPTPTVEGIEAPIDPLPNLSPSPSPTRTLQATASPNAVAVVGVIPSITPIPPTATLTPTETPGPWEHVVQAGESLSSIAAQYGFTDPGVWDAIVALNDNVPDVNTLPVGGTILIPRPTPTPTPIGLELTNEARESLGQATIAPNVDLNAPSTCHTVEEGETIVDIASFYNTTIEVLASLNPTLLFVSCDFDNRSGGPECRVNIQPGQCVNVPQPTVTPTLSATPSGNETATPTPTYAPPSIITPPNGAVVNGVLTLQWVSAGLLAPDEYYYVFITDTVAREQRGFLTKNTTFRLPDDLIPSDGQPHAIEWSVTVARSSDGQNDVRQVGGNPLMNTFTWNSR